MHKLVKGGLAAGVLLGSLMLGQPAAVAVTDHCDPMYFKNKVEVGGEYTKVYTGLEPGTSVCIKSANTSAVVTVDSDGYITNTIRNQNDKIRAISYYAWGVDYGGY